MSEKFIIVDGNSVLYREFYALPLTMRNSLGEPTNAIYGFAKHIIGILQTYSPTHMAVAFDAGKHTFRNDMFADYKKTRKPMADELRVQLGKVKEMLSLMGIKAVEQKGIEGDDILGSLAKKFNMPTIIITGDRDSYQLIDDNTVVYLNRKGLTDVKVMDKNAIYNEYKVTPQQFVFVKALAGDSSDNIPGAKGIGEKTAIELINTYGNIDEIYNNLDKLKPSIATKLKQSKELVDISLRLAKIKTDAELDVTKNDLLVKLPFDKKVLDFFTYNDFKSLANKQELFSDCNVQIKRELKNSVLINNSEQLNNVISLINKSGLFSYVIVNNQINIGVLNDNYIVPNNLSEDFYKLFKPAFEDEQILKILLNSKQNRKLFDELNIKLSDNFFDCLIACHLVSGEKKVELTEISNDFEMITNLPALEMLNVYNELTNKLGEMGLNDLYYTLEKPLSVVLHNMESRGFKIDVNRLKELKTKYKAEELELTTKIYESVGKEFNINSPKQLSAIIYDELGLSKSKKKSTNVEALEKISDRHPVVSLVLRYRKVSKFVSTFLESLEKHIDANGYIHTNFNQTLTTTGRLSSSEPNLQNIPIRGEESREIRSMFVASSVDNVLIDADYSQIELRVLAHLCDDKNLKRAFKDGKDIHTQTAMGIFNVPEYLVDSEMRRQAKVVNFGINYGMSEFGLADDLNVPIYVAKEYIDNYYLAHPNVKSYIESSVLKARETGIVSTLLGRIRKINEINSSNYMVRMSAERAAQNMPVQGTAADIIKIAMLALEDSLKLYKAKLIMQVHDELIIDCPKSEQNDVVRIVKTVMENAFKLSVPLEIDYECSYRWSEGH